MAHETPHTEGEAFPSLQASRPTLRKGSRGPAVTELQQRLDAAGFDPGTLDGIFGSRTDSAVREFQQARGLAVDGIVGPATWEALLGPSVPTTDYRVQLLNMARWGMANESSIHYEQRRPIDGTDSKYKLPLYTDCSGFLTLCYQWAGASDPNGFGFNGSGYTGSMLAYMRQISRQEAREGDLVLWHQSGKGVHVCMALDSGSDPMLVSHGSETGPKQIRLSAEDAYFRGRYGSSITHVWLTLPRPKAGLLTFLKRKPAPIPNSDPPAEEVSLIGQPFQPPVH